MAWDAKTFLTSIENLLIKNNTSTATYDISSALHARVKTFYKGASKMYIDFPVPQTLYPCIFTELKSKTEEYRVIRRPSNAQRDLSVQVDIIPVCSYGAGMVDARENASLECLQLTQNIEDILRNNITLSISSVHMSNIVNTEYGVKIKNEYYNSLAIISLNIKTRAI